MNNIEILEEFIKHYKEVQEKYKDDEIQAEIERSCYFEEVPAEAIENLIQENKKLKDTNMKMALSGGSFEAIDYIEKNYIQKLKIEKLKEKIHNLLDDNGITRVYQLEIDKYFEDLEKGE